MARKGSSGRDGVWWDGAFADAAEKYGISEEHLRKTAFLESSNRPGAVSPAGARGLMQFLSGAAREVGLKNPGDPVSSIHASARFDIRNRDYLSSKLGREPEDWELFFARKQGRYGAAAIMENPERNAAAVLAQFHKNPVKAITLNGGHAKMTGEEFLAEWKKRYEQAPVPGKSREARDIPDTSISTKQDGSGSRRKPDPVARDVFGPSTVGEGFHEDDRDPSAEKRPPESTPRSVAQEVFGASNMDRSGAAALKGFNEASLSPPFGTRPSVAPSPEAPAPSPPDSGEELREKAQPAQAPAQSAPAPHGWNG